MGYSFTIGKAGVQIDGEGADITIYPYTIDCEYDGEPSTVWVDDMGSDGPTRCPSYSQWSNTLDQLPRFKHCFEFMEKEHKLDKLKYEYFMPCRMYEDLLDGIETEAGGASDRDAAKRAMWFVKWSREALKRYGDFAAFQTPGEW